MYRHHASVIRLIQLFSPDPDVGAEIGVGYGKFVLAVHKYFPHCFMYLVDPWQVPAEGSSFRQSVIMGGLSSRDWQKMRRTAEENLRLSRGDGKILPTDSRTAAGEISDGSLDFVFIDADHSFRAVRQDIRLWLPKTRRLICGHDYGGYYRGVKKAVDRVFGRRVITMPGKVWGVPL